MHVSSFLSSPISLAPETTSHYPLLHSGCLKGDNYGYFIQTGLRDVITVDVPDGRKMLQILEHKKWKLQALLLTHTHHDHVVHLEELIDKTGCDFYHPQGADLPVKGIPLEEDRETRIQGFRMITLNTSGHSPLDFSYWFPDLRLCFCGDTLFASGCGRMFAGPAERFWNSLKKLRELPDETLLCCGHDYGEDNLRFVKQALPGLTELVSPIPDTQMPLQLGNQKRVNPFLRADDSGIAVALGLENRNPVEVFKFLRESRNQL